MTSLLGPTVIASEELLLFVTVLWGPWMKATLVTRARGSRGVPWAAATKIWAPDKHKSTFLGDTGDLGVKKRDKDGAYLWRVLQ